MVEGSKGSRHDSCGEGLSSCGMLLGECEGVDFSSIDGGYRTSSTASTRGAIDGGREGTFIGGRCKCWTWWGIGGEGLRGC